jgi:SAM-dependent methyltransferase
MTSDADRVVDLYRRHVAAFDKLRSRHLMEGAWLDRFAALLPKGATVLDIGCGMGEPIARHLIESGYRVTGVDSSPGMIDLCRQRFPACDWHVADMRTLSLDRLFQGLLAWDSFFFLTPEDQRRMFAIFRAHAAPNAALMFTSGPRHGEVIGRFEGEPLYHASLDAAEYRSLLGAHGFEVVSHVAEDPTCGMHTIWLAQRQG